MGRDTAECLLRRLTDGGLEKGGSKASTFPSSQWDCCSVAPAGPRWGRSSWAGGQGCEEATPLSPAPLPSAHTGWFYHIKMFGLMGLTRLLGAMKKGPLFPCLLRCTLTYFWEAVADHEGHRGGLWRSWWWREPVAFGVCVRNAQSDLGRGQRGPVRTLASPFSPRNTFRSWLCGFRPVLPFWASVSPSAR